MSGYNPSTPPSTVRVALWPARPLKVRTSTPPRGIEPEGDPPMENALPRSPPVGAGNSPGRQIEFFAIPPGPEILIVGEKDGSWNPVSLMLTSNDEPPTGILNE